MVMRDAQTQPAADGCCQDLRVRTAAKVSPAFASQLQQTCLLRRERWVRSGVLRSARLR